MTHEEQGDQQLKPQPFVRGEVQAELNFVKYPFCMVSKNHLRPKESLVYEERLPDGIKRVWKVSPHIDFGFPSSFDDRVFITVQKIATDRGFPPQRFMPLGTLRGLCKMMGITASGKNANRIKESLKRIALTGIETNCFFQKRENGFWKEKGGAAFTVWNVYWQGEELPSGQTAESVVLELHAPFLHSLSDFYTLPLDYDFYMQLSPLASRLYALTRLKFFGLRDSKYVRFEYPQLCAIVPMRQQRYLANAKQVLANAHHELTTAGWFSRIDWQGGRDSRPLVDDMPWSIQYYPGKRAHAELARSRDRQLKFQAIEQKQRSLVEADSWARLDYLVDELAMKLQSPKNRPFFRLIAYQVVQGRIPEQLVYRLMSEARVFNHEGKIRATMSAWFTTELSRTLANKDVNFKALIRTAKQELDG